MLKSFALLVARQRSGTGALGSVLDQHNKLSYLGEALNVNDFGKEKNFFTFRDKEAQDAYDYLPSALVGMFERFLAAQTAADLCPIVDVKYSSLHQLNGSWHAPMALPAILQYARDNQAPVLHLRRRNTLLQYCSGRLAEKNKVWHASSSAQITHYSLAVDVNELMRFIEATEREDRQVEAWFSMGLNVLDVVYEDTFAEDGKVREEVAAQIAGFLGLEAFTCLTPAFVKQVPVTLDAVIENLAEVRAALEATEHGWMAEVGPHYADPPPSARIALNNAQAMAEVQAFRATQREAGVRRGAIDAAFHKRKNHFPYFGLVDVRCEGLEVAMYTGNDDLVALTYLWYGTDAFEPTSLRLWVALAKEAAAVLDLGSSSGIYALIAARARPTASIRAIEASRRSHGRMILNCFLNGLQDRIKVDCTAITDGEGQVRLNKFRGENILETGASVLDKNGLPVTDASEIVQTTSLDNYCEMHDFWPDLIKIDIEGAEVLALSGASRLLQHRPALIIEVTPQTFSPVMKILADFGYAPRLIEEGEGFADPDAQPRGVRNVVAVHPDDLRLEPLGL